MPSVFLGIGSNIDAKENLRFCATLLREQWSEIIFSSVYESAPQEFEEQEDFLNAVARFEGDDAQEEIQKTLEDIELRLGKDVRIPKGPRTIDLDLLLYGGGVMEREDVIVPHPRMHLRRFVVEPLCELIDPSSRHPILKTSWEEIKESVQNQRCEKIDLVL